MLVQGFVFYPYLPGIGRFLLVFVSLFALNKSYHLECLKELELDLPECTDARDTFSDDMQ
jgi:hypothetical protein